MMEELRRMQQEQRDYWSYVAARDAAMQKTIKANSRRYHSFPAFPEHILQPPTVASSDEE